jgi:hypothetical protein
MRIIPSPLRYVSLPNIGGNCGSGTVWYHEPLKSAGNCPSTTRSYTSHSIRDGALNPVKSMEFGNGIDMMLSFGKVAAP